MSFVKSKNIKFYPTGYRGNIHIGEEYYSFDPESKLNTEDNSRRAFNTLINYEDKSVYKNKGDLVITADYDWQSCLPDQEHQLDYAYNNFEFIIDGYYVKIIDSYEAFKDLLTSSTQEVYAILRVTNKGLKEPESKNQSSEDIDVNNTGIIGNAAVSLSSMSTQSYSPSVVDDAQSGREISNLDIKNNEDVSEFTAIDFVTTLPTSTTNLHIFKILEKNGNTWVVPNSAKMLVALDDIYGGDALDAASKTIKTDTVKSTTVKTTNTVTEYITKDTTVAEGNKSYIKLADDYIRINRQNDDLALSSKIDVKTNEIQLEQGTSYGNSHIRISKNGEDNSIIELSADGYGDFDPSWIQMKKGQIQLAQGPGDNEILLTDTTEGNKIEIHSKDNIDIGINESSLNYLYLTKNDGSNANFYKAYSIDNTNSEDTDYVKSSMNVSQRNMYLSSSREGEKNGSASIQIYSLQNENIWPMIPGILLKSTSEGILKSSEITSEKVETPLVYLKDETLYFGAENDTTPYTNLPRIRWVESSPYSYFKFENVGQATNISAARVAINDTVNGNYRLSVTGDAKFVGQVQANSFYATSDRRLKKNIQPFEYDKSILDLPVYTYNYINDNKKQIGCMAQDLQELYPELVNENDKGYLSVDNSKVVYLLLEEVKLLKKEIEDLKKSK